MKWYNGVSLLAFYVFYIWVLGGMVKVGFEILTMGWILLGLGYLFMVFTLATETYLEFYRLAASRLTTREKKVKHHQAYFFRRIQQFSYSYFKSFCL